MHRTFCDWKKPAGHQLMSKGKRSEVKILQYSERSRNHDTSMAVNGRILVRSDKSLFLLDRNQIDWIEAKGANTLLHCGTDHYSVRAGIRTVERELDSDQFIRIHRSYIVNINTIHELKPRTNRTFEVILRDGTELTWSRYYKDRLSLLEESLLRIPRI